MRLARHSFIYRSEAKSHLNFFPLFIGILSKSDGDLQGCPGVIESINPIFVHFQLLAHLKVLFASVNLCIQIKHATAAIDLGQMNIR